MHSAGTVSPSCPLIFLSTSFWSSFLHTFPHNPLDPCHRDLISILKVLQKRNGFLQQSPEKLGKLGTYSLGSLSCCQRGPCRGVQAHSVSPGSGWYWQSFSCPFQNVLTHFVLFWFDVCVCVCVFLQTEC